MRDINNNQDILDSRDVIARRDELAEERAALVETLADAKTAWEEPGRTAEEESQDEQEAREGAIFSALQSAEEGLRAWDADNAEELAALEAFIQDGSAEWDHGVTLVRETYFEDYAQEHAEELDLIPRYASWPASCIDWKQAARELRYDYTGADWSGVTYYYQG